MWLLEVRVWVTCLMTLETAGQWAYLWLSECSWTAPDPRSLGLLGTQISNLFEKLIFYLLFFPQNHMKKICDLKWLKIIMHGIRLLLLFFKDSRALLELIFYVSKYKYTLNFDFFFQFGCSGKCPNFSYVLHILFICVLFLFIIFMGIICENSANPNYSNCVFVTLMYRYNFLWLQKGPH